MFSKRGSKRLTTEYTPGKGPSLHQQGRGGRGGRGGGPPGRGKGRGQQARPINRGGVSHRALGDTWSEKDNVGVQDLVMLEDYLNEKAVMKNLEERYNKDLIYTYIGNVCISLNPYFDTGIYTDDFAKVYSNVNLYELPPHVYAIADQAYRSMRDELTDQCVLISGESGAGKTEASKKILQFLALNSTNTGKAGNIRDRLMETNSILEAFGNATTIRNDNSSRFGKYMEVQFDHKGEPLGGRILKYLLEKSRVIVQSPQERNFHIFYFLLASSEGRKFGLGSAPESYHFTNQGGAAKVSTLDDQKEFGIMYAALQKEGFEAKEITELFAAVAFIVHLGQVAFAPNGRDASKVRNHEILDQLEKLIGVPASKLGRALTHQTVVTVVDRAEANLSAEKALYARDALAKALYNRVFTWVVDRVNKSIAAKETVSRQTVMGLLDIYGFEIMTFNSFEQLCINYCNEKLQQLFIELTLRGEQEEYRREGIKWEPVKYFDNKIICEMVEAKHKGIVSILDEECIRPGEATDNSFLQKLTSSLKSHNHFQSFESVDPKTRKTWKSPTARSEFRVKHYAGVVTYNIDGFIDKNNDLLFRDLKEAMISSTNSVVSISFPKSELESRKRPVTAGTQFKTSLNQLVDILMKKTPSYIRCIKPNHQKARRKFDRELVKHQVQYLGLMENLRVRRAGFAYRRSFEVFLNRYKPLSKKTWPNFNGNAREGVQHITDALGLTPELFQLGVTKIFVRHPKTVTQIEARYQAARGALATKIQSKVKAYFQRKKFLIMKDAVSLISRQWRIVAAKKARKRLEAAIQTIKNFLIGYLHRHEKENELNKKFVNYVRISFLDQLKSCLPANVLDKSWMRGYPAYLEDASNLLRKLHRRTLVRKYVRSLDPRKRTMLDQKLEASQMFRDKKQSYPFSIADWFQNERLLDVEGKPSRLGDHPVRPAVDKILKNKKTPGVQMRYISSVKKFDRKTYKERDRVLVLTSAMIHIIDPKTKKIKFAVPLSELAGIHISNGFDSMMILKTKQDQKKTPGDFVLHVPHLIEACHRISVALRLIGGMQAAAKISIQQQLAHFPKGKAEPVPISLITGPELKFAKDKKSKKFVVTTPAQQYPLSWQRWAKYKGVPPRDPGELEFGAVRKEYSPGRRSSISKKSPSPSPGRGRGGRSGGRGRGRSGPAGRAAQGRGRGQARSLSPDFEEDAGMYDTPALAKQRGKSDYGRANAKDKNWC